MVHAPLDEKYMRRALELAEYGRGRVQTNPLVGCVITYKGRIVGEGWHQAYGGPHAEVHAVRAVKDPSLLPHCTVYVTLEPCAHQGKTPPCADLLVSKQVKRVVVAMQDPNPKVDGGGIAKLTQAGIAVTTGVLEAEAKALNRRFITFMATQRPYVVLKWAQTADGFLARANGDSKWISNAQARQWVHRWRAEEDAILVGPNTVKLDNPSLTVRDWTGSHPTRVILDRKGSLSADHRVFDGQVPTRRYTTKPTEAIAGVASVVLPEKDFLPSVLHDLYQAGVGSLFVEGGAAVLSAFIAEGMWDEGRIFTAPTTFGEGYAAPHLPGVVQETVAVQDNQLTIIENKQAIWRRS